MEEIQTFWLRSGPTWFIMLPWHEFAEHQLCTVPPRAIGWNREVLHSLVGCWVQGGRGTTGFGHGEKLLRDILLLSNFCHTGMLHSSINCITMVCTLYAPNGYNRAAQPDVIKILWLLILKWSVYLDWTSSKNQLSYYTDSGTSILTLPKLETDYSCFEGQYHACWCPGS